MRRIVLLEDGSREDACIAFDKAKSEINDFTKETVALVGDVRKPKEGWRVIKTCK